MLSAHSYQGTVSFLHSPCFGFGKRSKGDSVESSFRSTQLLSMLNNGIILYMLSEGMGQATC